jgi:hypothetical protein
MKDLIGKRARIAAPGLFDGERTVEGFEYSRDGTGIWWPECGVARGEFLPVGLISVLDTPVAVGGAKPKRGKADAALAAENDSLREELQAVKAQLKEQAEAAQRPVDEPPGN